jgi:acyl-CoA synthetase (AMP-forming)/AMP-acid ligase II
MRGEVVGAALVLKQGVRCSEAVLLKFCLERLANYKVPKYFVFWNDLPKMSGGGIDKPLIRNFFEKQACGEKEN